MSRAFKPAWWLANPHLQTLWSTFFRKFFKKVPLDKERLELPDGDFLDLNWLGKTEKGPLVILLHGLEGSVASPYAMGMMKAVQQAGFRAVFMHFRGCSGEPNRLARSYHSGETGDIAMLVKILKEREPHTPMAAVGFSLGGNVLLKWLGETGSSNPLAAACVVSVPFELHNAANRIQKGFSRIYQKHFLKCVYNRMSYKFEHFPAPFELPPFMDVNTLWEFDDKVTAPLHGFVSAKEYYDKSSCRKFLKNIAIPTLLLQAEDDPFMTKDVIPLRHELSPCVILEVSAGGGHVGFIGGKFPWRAEYWLEKRIPDFLKEHVTIAPTTESVLNEVEVSHF